MKRILLATAGVAVVAVFAATIGFAQPTATTGSVAAEAAAPLPKLPANIKERQRFIVGVKCDALPFGYINVQGKNAGFDVEIAKWFARYAFGRESRVSYICALTPAREPVWKSRSCVPRPSRRTTRRCCQSFSMRSRRSRRTAGQPTSSCSCSQRPRCVVHRMCAKR